MIREALYKVVCAASAMGLCAVLAGCVTARSTAPADLGLFVTALSQPVDQLQENASRGQAGAQYAVALLQAYGMRGLPRDPVQAALLRRSALAARGYTPITTYIAGLQGKPGRVAIINVPRYELDLAQVGRIDQCAAALARGDQGAVAVQACAGPEEFARLKGLWAEAKTGN